jgi:hypothetical protein
MYSIGRRQINESHFSETITLDTPDIELDVDALNQTAIVLVSFSIFVYSLCFPDESVCKD